MADRTPTPALVIREHDGRPFYEAKFRYGGRQVKRRLGAAWLTRTADGGWKPHSGRVPDGQLDERRANVLAAEAAAAYVHERDSEAARERARATAGPTFREVAHAYLAWLETVKAATPATLRQHRSDLSESGVPYKRGGAKTAGHIMRVLGDKPATKITTADVDAVLDAVAATGVAPRTINRYREVMCAAFNFAVRSSKFKLPSNPATDADRRRLRVARPLVYYTTAEIETIADALEAGLHREVNERHSRACRSRQGGRCNCTPTYRARGLEFTTLDDARAHNRKTRQEDEIADDRRDANAVRVAAYAGLRLGELLALKVGDIDFAGCALTISRAMSAGVEGGTKSGRVRQVPLADRAAQALTSVLIRNDFTDRQELVFCTPYGRALDGSALRRRYKRARDAAGMRPLRWHDLRHTFGSLLIAGGVDLVSVKDAMGHSQLSTTSRYLHARPATERAAAFTAAFDATDGGGARTLASRAAGLNT